MRYGGSIIIICVMLAGRVAGARNLIGMNMPTPLDWEGSDVFADTFRTARDWENAGGGTVGKDGNGWPTQDAQIVRWHGADMTAGYPLNACRGRLRMWTNKLALCARACSVHINQPN